MKIVLYSVFIFINLFLSPSVFASTNTHSLDFESDSDQYIYAQDDDSLDLTGDLTIETWFKPESITGNHAFVAKWDSVGNNLSFGFRYLNGPRVLSFHTSYNGVTPFWLGEVSYELDLDTWYHLAVTFDASLGSAEFFVNGQSIGVRNGYPNSIYNSAGVLNVGSTQGGREERLDGLMDEVRVWNDVRTQEEILANMSTEILADTSNLVAQWSMNEVLSDALSNLDLSNTGNNNFSQDIPFPLEENQNPYPLYTQIESPYPSVEETAGWEDDVYANGDDGLCYSKTGNGNTVGECGCVITSLVMSGRNAGVEKDILGDDVNPSNMNDYLESVNGYTEDGAIRWLAGSAYLGKLNSSGKITSRFASAPTRPVSEGSTMNFIDQALTEGGNIVLAYSGGHFVWLPEKTSDSYLVRDPWWYETETADQDNLVGETYVRDYNNSFSDARVIKISDEPTEFSGNDIEVHARGTVELLYEKATGEKVGFSDDSVVVDLENASYGDIEIISLAGDENSTGKHLLVYGAGEDFTIKVIGTRNGEYSLEFFTINEFGEVTTFKFSGEIEEGDIRIYTVDLETGEMELVDEEEEEEADLDREAFVALVEEATEDSRKNVQRFFVRVANRIFDSIEKDRNKLAQLQLKVFKKLLKAKRINDSELSEAIDEIGNSLR